MAHPCHEFPWIRDRIGRELGTDMTQVVNSDLRQPDRSAMTSRAVARYKPVATSVVIPR